VVPDRSTLTGTNRPDPELQIDSFRGISPQFSLIRRDLGMTGLISLYETNPGFIKIRPQGLNTDETVRITVVWRRLVTTVVKR
jgi:hypothetical protein